MRRCRLMLVYTVIKYNNNIAGGDISNLVQDFFLKRLIKILFYSVGGMTHYWVDCLSLFERVTTC